MKNSISLYFQPYYFKGGSGDVFKGINSIDLKASYVSLVNRQRGVLGFETDFGFESTYITCAKYVLAKLRTTGTVMDIQDIYILNNLMSNTLTSGIKQLVTDTPDVVNREKSGYAVYGDFTSNVLKDIKNDMRNKQWIEDTLFFRDRVLPLGHMLCADFNSYDSYSIDEDCKMKETNQSFAHITDQSVNDFLSVLSKDDTLDRDRVIEYGIEDAISVRWVNVVNLNTMGFWEDGGSVDKPTDDGMIGVVTCNALFGKMLAKSAGKKSNEELRDKVVEYLYNDLLKNNKEDFVAGSDLEALYLLSKRLK